MVPRFRRTTTSLPVPRLRTRQIADRPGTTLHKPGQALWWTDAWFPAVLVVILMLATLGVLIAGMVGMVREGSPRRSNKLMQLRVLLQGAAILLFVILMSLLRS